MNVSPQILKAQTVVAFVIITIILCRAVECFLLLLT